MFRLLKALPLILTIVALSIITASCGTNQAKVRVVNAIPDASANLDVFVNGSKVATNLAFTYVYPTPTTPVSYVQVPSGSDSIISYNTGTTTNAISTDQSAKLNASDQYTVLLAGFLQHGPQTYVFQDDNTAPNQNTGENQVEFRIMNGSANTPSGGFDVCIYQTNLTQPTTPTISGLLLGQSSSYLSLTYESSYTVLVTTAGSSCNGTIYVNRSYGQNSSTNGQITTLVIVDNANGQGVSATPILMTDLD
jgi:hypothetical protein